MNHTKSIINPHKKNKSKFEKLNFNLVNEIFEYLDIPEKIQTISFLNLKSKKIISKIKIFNNILEDRQNLLKKISFNEKIFLQKLSHCLYFAFTKDQIVKEPTRELEK